MRVPKLIVMLVGLVMGIVGGFACSDDNGLLVGSGGMGGMGGAHGGAQGTDVVGGSDAFAGSHGNGGTNTNTRPTIAADAKGLFVYPNNLVQVDMTTGAVSEICVPDTRGLGLPWPTQANRLEDAAWNPNKTMLAATLLDASTSKRHDLVLIPPDCKSYTPLVTSDAGTGLISGVKFVGANIVYVNAQGTQGSDIWEVAPSSAAVPTRRSRFRETKWAANVFDVAGGTICYSKRRVQGLGDPELTTEEWTTRDVYCATYPDMEGETKVGVGTERYTSRLSVSEDGKYVLFKPAFNTLRMASTDGLTDIEIGNCGQTIIGDGGAWTPDGKTIVYTCSQVASQRIEIWRVAPDGTNARKTATIPWFAPVQLTEWR